MAEENGVRFCDACGISLADGQGFQDRRALLCYNCYIKAAPSPGDKDAEAAKGDKPSPLATGTFSEAAEGGEPTQRVGSRFGRGTRIFLTLACLALLAVTLYPPWTYTFQSQGISQVTNPGPRAFLFLPPAPELGYLYSGVHLDYGRLLVEWLCIGALSALLLIVVRISPREWFSARGRRIAGWSRKHKAVLLAAVVVAAVGLVLWFSPWFWHWVRRSEVIVDATTDLMWTASVSEPMHFDEVNKYVQNLRAGGYDDWRLPTEQDLKTLLRKEFRTTEWELLPGPALRDEFSTPIDGYVWSGSRVEHQTSLGRYAPDPTDPLVMNLWNGWVFNGRDCGAYVRAARGRAKVEVGPSPKDAAAIDKLLREIEKDATEK